MGAGGGIRWLISISTPYVYVTALDRVGLNVCVCVCVCVWVLGAHRIRVSDKECQ